MKPRQKKEEENIRRAEEIVKHILKPSWKHLLEEEGLIDKYSEALGKNLNTTQLRKFFDDIVRLREKSRQRSDWEEELWQLVPKVKYAKGRGQCPDAFVKFISMGVDVVTSGTDEEEKRKRLENFIKIFEAIVAYHKYHHQSGGG